MEDSDEVTLDLVQSKHSNQFNQIRWMTVEKNYEIIFGSGSH